MADFRSIDFKIEKIEGVSFSPETGELVISALQNNEAYIHHLPMNLVLSEKATASLLEALQTLKNDFGELIEIRNNKTSLQ